MKLSIAVAGALVAGAAAAAVAEEAPDLDFHYDGRLRKGHGFVPREAEAEVEKRDMGMHGMNLHGGRTGMPCPQAAAAAAAAARRKESERSRSDSWVPGPIGAMLSRLGLDIGAPSRGFDVAHHHEHHHPHAPGHGDGHHKDHHKEAAGHPGHHSEGDNIDFSIFVPIGHPVMKEEEMRILPIFGEDVNAKQEEHRQKLKADKVKEQDEDDEDDDDDDDDDDDEEDHHHHGKHKHHHKHKHGHKGKHHGHKGKMSVKDKACDMFASLPHLRAALSALMYGGAFLFTVFGLAFLVAHRRNISREERKTRRRERKEARRAAKNAYKAAKAARNSKEAEAGFEYEAEALPSYADNETDALVTRQ